MIKYITLNLFCLCSFLLLLSCKQPADTAIGTPKIQAGIAKITGKIISPNDRHKNDGVVEIIVPHPISGELAKYKAVIDQSGRFAIDVDVETDVSIIGLYTSLKPYNTLLFKVRSGDVTNLDITYSMNLDIEDVQTKPEMNRYEMMQSMPIINKMLGIYSSEPDPKVPLNDTSPQGFLKHIKTTVNDKLKAVDKDSLLSEEWKGYMYRDFRIWYYAIGTFNFETSIKMAYRNSKDSTAVPEITKVDKSYFSYFKELDLNSPQYLVCGSFSDFQREVLKNEILAIPQIGETAIPTWLTGVKAILSNLVGFKDGQYYDILVANAYGKQLIEDAKPFSEKQKKNIVVYWKEDEIAKILLRKNEKVIAAKK
ncbi:MAG: hypothetical protein WKF66_13465 [Pedobacter sp.]